MRLCLLQRLELVLSDDALNGFYDTACRVNEAFTAPLTQVVAQRMRPPYALRNETGVPIRYAKAGSSTDGPLARIVRAGEEEDVALWELDPVQTQLHCSTRPRTELGTTPPARLDQRPNWGFSPSRSPSRALKVPTSLVCVRQSPSRCSIGTRRRR